MIDTLSAESIMIATPHKLEMAFKVTHYAVPGLVMSYFLLAQLYTVCTTQSRRLRAQDQHVRRDIMLALIYAVVFSYLVEIFVLALQNIIAHIGSPEDCLVYLIASILCFGTQALLLRDTQLPIWYPYHITWLIGFGAELFLLLASKIAVPPKTAFDITLTVMQCIRVCLFLILPTLYYILRNNPKEYDNVDPERQSLLGKKLAGQSTGSYGATTDTSSQDATGQDSDTAVASDTASEDSWEQRERATRAKMQKRLEQDGNWFTYARAFAIFIPYVWPVNNRGLQIRAILTGFCLLMRNALNVLVPWTLGLMLDRLTRYAPEPHQISIIYVLFPVILYTFFKFINGETGLGWLKQWLWLPVEQYSHDALNTAAHAHLMNLSSDFHDSKEVSELTQAIYGSRSISLLLDKICFQFLPMLIDLVVAFVYLWAFYGPFMGLIMLSTAITYLYITTKLHTRRTQLRKDFIKASRTEWTTASQSLEGWTTASLFNMIPYEQDRYSSAVGEYVSHSSNWEHQLQFVSAIQASILSIGLIAALWLGIWQVATRGESVGKFAALLVYWATLTGPLSFFASMYRSISHSLMDAERLLELFQTKPTITDLPNAEPLILGKGVVVFDHVTFAYDDRNPTLKNVSFEIPAGQTVALVGETGGGKSTILKLVNRFYDIKKGSISIDGQDIRDVTLSSLRSKIGVVPQDPNLFNDSIMNNLRYARLSATDEEIYEACKAAAVHDKIMSFPDGYASKVGAHGMKLSGGEKQRVAIARAMLKQPNIVLLDEATSAVDTDTEQEIQKGLTALCKDRTTFVVAHRLSTILNSDLILVIMNGEVIEQGSHEELLGGHGKYFDLWSKQIGAKTYAPTTGATASTFASRSRTISPKNSITDLVNDLTPIRQGKEQNKVLQVNRSRSNSGASGTSGDSRTSGKQASKLPVCVKHNTEVFKLKPDAPEFVPSSCNPSIQGSPSPVSRSVRKMQIREGKKPEFDVKTVAVLTRKVETPAKKVEIPTKKVDGLAKKVEVPAEKVDVPAKKVEVPEKKFEKTLLKLVTETIFATASICSTSPTDDPFTDGALATIDNNKPKPDNTSSKSAIGSIKSAIGNTTSAAENTKSAVGNTKSMLDDAKINNSITKPTIANIKFAVDVTKSTIGNTKAQPRRSRIQRMLSRSDPAPAVGISQAAGQQDSVAAPGTPMERKNSQGSSIPVPRRVSAPNAPPTRQNPTPRRRSRHFRIKNRAIASAAATANTTTSGDV